jgi:selenium-binding protein 1
MPRMTPDPTFYPTAKMAMEAPPERLGYVVLMNPALEGEPDAMGVVDLDSDSSTYGQLVGKTSMPVAGDELHHFGWNACSSCLCPTSPHPHMDRRYLVVPGLRSSKIHFLDVKDDPTRPKIVKVIEAKEIADKTGYSRLHTSHCGPDGIYMNALGAPDGGGPGGILVLDAETLEVKGPWEADRGPQTLAYDFWWHLGQDTMITSEWGTPNMVEGGLNPEILMSGGYGHRLHVWDLAKRTHREMIDLGEKQQMVLELRPSHDPNETYGFVGVVISLEDLSSSIWMWHREGKNGNGRWKATKVIEIPAEPADPADLPPALKPFSAAPPLVSDINLSLDDRSLYVSCWGTGQLLRYDVTDPFNPELASSLRIGGMVGRTPHPAAPGRPLNGGPQMVELSRDGRRVYLTNSLYASWDAQFYPDGIQGWMVKIDAAEDGSMAFDERFLLEDFGSLRPHQVHLEGGDASSDSYCFA